ncbi:MAG: glycogen debranching protein GlgX [Rhizobium sp.]|nr:glycogen debranching protein GlgX [Rhizobium sp.]
MDAKVSQYSIQADQPGPLGATLVDGGINFAVFSAHAHRIELCLFDPSGTIEIQRLTLPENTHEVFHGFVPGLAADALYGFRAHGPFDPENGHRFNPNKLLADPYARGYQGILQNSPTHFGYDLMAEDKDLNFDESDNALYMPKCRIIPPRRHDGPSRPAVSWPRTMVYETHVKGFTKLNPHIPEALRGTFEGLGHKAAVDYIKSLGITSVELLPVHEFFDDFHLADKGLTNYWGYNTFGFFAPASRYFGPAGHDGFIDMVRAYHDAGLEVILDVVYNHTAEGNELGPTLSFKGLDNFSYYRTLPGQHRYYINDTGTGNTLNTSHPRVLQMVMDSLRYWVEEMEVDGFRFDLGTILGREPEGFDQRGGFFDAIMQDPVLSRVKLIGEPWDIGPGGYQVGGFPPGWAEWNDKYRDSVRDYWKGDEHTAPDFAARILGSGDCYDQRGRRPWSSVNFITAHDGFTLGDLVSYDNKHNEANGEDGRDGHNHNRSHNYGAEGPTDNPDINAVRERQKRNFLATLFFSHGTPMLLAGDEIGHSQSGNNNGYCQDNELTWLNWDDLSGANAELLEFTKRVIALRNEQPLLRRENWRDGMNVNWYAADGGEQLPEHWHDETTLSLHLERGDLRDKPEFWAEVLMIFNPRNEDVEFKLPDFGDEDWKFALATAETPLSEGPVKARKPVQAKARSFMLFYRNGKA